MDRLKAKFFLLLISLLWLRLILAQPEIIFFTFLSLFKKGEKYKKYVWGLWIADDQAVNARLGGNPDVTVSSKVGVLSNKFGKHPNRPSMTARAMEKFIDTGFKAISGQENHCDESYEPDEEHYSYFWR